MILSDRTIRDFLSDGRIIIEPFSDDCIQPSSIDLHLSPEFLVFRNLRQPFIDVRQNQNDLTDSVIISDGEVFILHPGEFALGSTTEIVGNPNNLIGRLDGKSSLGRCGLMIHSTAGYIDPGFRGQLTLELSNAANLPIALYPGMRIAQVSFVMMTTPAVVPYGSASLRSKYQGQKGPQPSALHREFALDINPAEVQIIPVSPESGVAYTVTPLSFGTNIAAHSKAGNRGGQDTGMLRLPGAFLVLMFFLLTLACAISKIQM